VKEPFWHERTGEKKGWLVKKKSTEAGYRIKVYQLWPYRTLPLSNSATYIRKSEVEFK